MTELRIVACVISLMLLSSVASYGQASSPEQALAKAVEALEDGRSDEAVAALRPIVDADPAYYSPEHGIAALWLGRALKAEGAIAEATQVWQTSLYALADAGILNVRMADAFVRTVFAARQQASYPAAANAYRWMLHSLDAGPDAEQRALIDQHLYPLTFILPPDVLRRTGLHALIGKNVRENGIRPVMLADSAGEHLAAWWRSQDMILDTPENERLHEHLERVAHAWEHYHRDGILDDRARVYIRLGTPYKRAKVRFDSPAFVNKIILQQTNLSAFNVPKNEFWVYNHIDRSAQYLFVSDLGYYELGTPNDLMPSELTHGLMPNERGMRKSEALIRTMEEVYRDLALLHDVYALRYADIADYAESLELQEMASNAENELAGRPSDPSGISRLPARADFISVQPHTFAQEMVARADFEDAQAADRRKKDVPETYTELGRDVGALPVAVRTARFLEDDGTTRTEVVWGLPPGALEPSGEGANRLEDEGFTHPVPYLLNVTVAQRDVDYRDRILNVHRHLIRQGASADDRGVLAPQRYTLRGDRGRYHVLMQWDQRPAVVDEASGRPVDLGTVVQRQFARRDSLQALDASGRILELSDPLPLVLSEDEKGVIPTLDAATPYPYRRITKNLPLALYFEVYHLTLGSDDRTRYTVTYEVRREGSDGVLRFLGRGDDEVTSARTTNTGTTRTASELILIDLSDWKGDGDIEVTLRVTDETTGAQAQRSIDFELVEAR